MRVKNFILCHGLPETNVGYGLIDLIGVKYFSVLSWLIPRQLGFTVER